MDLIDGRKDSFYLIKMCLWLKEGVCVMIWALSTEQKITGPSKSHEGVKLNFTNYCDFRDKSEPQSFRLKCVFTQDNACFPVSKVTHRFVNS